MGVQNGQTKEWLRRKRGGLMDGQSIDEEEIMIHEADSKTDGL